MLKDTILKIGCCLFLVVMVVAIGLTLLFVSNDMQPVDIRAVVVGALSKVYPRMADGAASSTDL